MVWLNRNGNKNEITPYGIGIRFIRISSADQRFIVNEVLRHLNSESVETSSSVVFQTTAADQEVESGEAM